MRKSVTSRCATSRSRAPTPDDEIPLRCLVELTASGEWSVYVMMIIIMMQHGTGTFPGLWGHSQREKRSSRPAWVDCLLTKETPVPRAYRSDAASRSETVILTPGSMSSHRVSINNFVTQSFSSPPLLHYQATTGSSVFIVDLLST